MSLLFVDPNGPGAEIIDDEGHVIPVVAPHHEDFEATRELEAELERLGYLETGDVALDVFSKIVQERNGHLE